MVVAVVMALALAGGSGETQAPTQVSPLVVSTHKLPHVVAQMDSSDDWIHKPDNALILSVWPVGAYQARISGRATLSCKVDAHGLAEECDILSEDPKGRGFGAAALLLRPTFKLKPAMGPDGPITAMMNIPITFNADTDDNIQLQDSSGMPDMGRRTISLNGTRAEMREVTMLDHPIWAQAAGFDDLARAYPAKGGGLEGYAVAHCHVERSGALTGCEVRKDTPDNHGFGLAAVSLAAHFRVSPDSARSPHRNPLWVDVPVRFPPTDELHRRVVSDAVWIAGFDPEKTVKLFPPEAAAKGLTTGKGVARCVIAPDGAMTGCTPLPGDPDGLGFSEAVVKLASAMRMNPWTPDGGPVDGAVINIPIRLNLAAKK